MLTDDSTMTTATTLLGNESFVDVPTNGGLFPPPLDALTLSVLPKHDMIGIDSTMTNTQICANIKARDLDSNEAEDNDDQQRAPVDIMVALDTSGSMSGKKLELCKRTLHLLVRVLLPKDRFGLINYGSNANLKFPLKKMTTENKMAAIKSIDSLRTSGQTNMSAAIGLAYQEMYAMENPNSVRSIFLLTDGHANQGISDRSGLVELTRNCYHNNSNNRDNSTVGSLGGRFKYVCIPKTEMDVKSPPTSIDIPGPPPTQQANLFCFGYGTDHNSDLLQDLADATEGGSYHFVQDDTDVGSAFGDALGGILSMVAQNAVLTVKVPTIAAAANVQIQAVHHDNAIQRENGSYTVTIGDFYADESRDVIIEVSLAKLDSETVTKEPFPHLEVTLSYSDVIQKRPMQTSPVFANIQRPLGTNEVSVSNEHVEAQCLRVHAAQEMLLADEEARKGQFALATQRIGAFEEKMKKSSSAVKKSSVYGQLRLDTEEIAGAFKSRSAYGSFGSKRSKQVMKCTSSQRSAAPCMLSDGSLASNVYQNKRRGMMARGFNSAMTTSMKQKKGKK